jgi:hypothetical protein
MRRWQPPLESLQRYRPARLDLHESGSLESPLKGHQPLYVLNFFIFDLEYLIRVQSSEPLHAKRPLILLLVRITVCMCSNLDLFRRTLLQKCGRDINCSLGCGLHPSFRNPNQN